MRRIKILDCTLRDGGYVNNWHFGKNAIAKIIQQLTNAGVDIIECGFLEQCDYDEDCSFFNHVDQIGRFIPEKRKSTIYVAMTRLGNYSIELLPPYDGKSIDGIRVSFHYNEFEDAMDFCYQIKDKGYKVFLQPVGTTSYCDEMLLSLINLVNKLKPYSFYIVDTLGLMHREDVLRFFYLINHNLDKCIHMGFHSHNNLQLSYSNCQSLTALECDRTLSLDASVYGMGRGAGNLNTELMANFLNTHQSHRYEIEPLLEIIDEYIAKIKATANWGYSVPYYLAAINGCHPNYATYLSSKQRLTIKNISTILRSIEVNKRSLFDKNLAEKKYLEFQSREIDDKQSLLILKNQLEGKTVLVLAPGPSINKYKDQILHFAEQEDCVTISVGFVPQFIECDYTFISNLKRYHTTFNPTNREINLIYTSNLDITEGNRLVVNYSSLLSENDLIMDNTAIMLLNLLMKLGPSNVVLAGLDGYTENGINFYQERLSMSNQDNATMLNNAMALRIKEISSSLPIRFLTPSLYNR